MRSRALLFAALTACGPMSVVPDECPAPSAAGTTHTATIRAPETWSAATSPHLISSALSVQAEVTIEPCALVQLGPDVTVTVTTGGRLVAAGSANKPVTFDAIDRSRPWSQLRALSGGTLSFTHTRVFGGGAPLNAPLDVAAAIDLRGPDQTKPPQETFHADHVLIQDSASQGISLREAGGFSSTSTALEIRGSKNVPIRSWASAAGTLPTGTFTGNGKDEIVLEGAGLGAISRDLTLRALGVPYRVGDSLTEGGLGVAAPSGQVATLTIEPGVTLRFKKNGGLFVQYSQNALPATGALIAAGTQAAPIVFTSAEATPAAGDWLGLHFNGTLNPNTRLDFVRVEYAGGTTSLVGASCRLPDNVNNAAAIRFFQAPASANVLTNSVVVASARHGVDRGWSGTSSVSFLSENDLSGAARCKETFPTPTGMACPNPPPCP